MGKTKAKPDATQEAPQDIVTEEVAETPPAKDGTTTVADLGAMMADQAPEARANFLTARAENATKPAETVDAPATPTVTGGLFSTTPAPEPTTKRGRPRKPEAELKEPRRKVKAGSPAPLPAAPVIPGPDINASTAEMFTTLKEGVLVSVIGDEWKMTAQEKTAENALLAAALNKYSPAGMELNPLVLYTAVSISHAAQRFQKPKTQDWWGRFKGNMAARYARLKYGKKSQDIKDASHTNRGPDNVGQNNTGGATGTGGAQ